MDRCEHLVVVTSQGHLVHGHVDEPSPMAAESEVEEVSRFVPRVPDHANADHAEMLHHWTWARVSGGSTHGCALWGGNVKAGNVSLSMAITNPASSLPPPRHPHHDSILTVFEAHPEDSIVRGVVVQLCSQLRRPQLAPVPPVPLPLMVSPRVAQFAQALTRARVYTGDERVRVARDETRGWLH